MPLPLAGTTSRRGTFGSQRRAAETCAQALRFRCVEGVVVAGEILPRPPACQIDFFDKLRQGAHPCLKVLTKSTLWQTLRKPGSSRASEGAATSPGESFGFQPGATETCAVAVAPRKAGCDQPPGNFQFLSARCWPLQSIAKRPVRQCASVSVRSRQGSETANTGAYMDSSRATALYAPVPASAVTGCPLLDSENRSGQVATCLAWSDCFCEFARSCGSFVALPHFRHNSI